EPSTHTQRCPRGGGMAPPRGDVPETVPRGCVQTLGNRTHPRAPQGAYAAFLRRSDADGLTRARPCVRRVDDDMADRPPGRARPRRAQDARVGPTSEDRRADVAWSEEDGRSEEALVQATGRAARP